MSSQYLLDDRYAITSSWKMCNLGTLGRLPRDVFLLILCFLEPQTNVGLVCKTFQKAMMEPRVVECWKRRKYRGCQLVDQLPDSMMLENTRDDEIRRGCVRQIAMYCLNRSKDHLGWQFTGPLLMEASNGRNLRRLCLFVLGNQMRREEEYVILTCGTLLKILRGPDARDAALALTTICKIIPDAMLPCFSGHLPELLVHRDVGLRRRAVCLLYRCCEADGHHVWIDDKLLEQLFSDKDGGVSIAALALVDRFDFGPLVDRIVRAFIVRNLESGVGLCDAIRTLSKRAYHHRTHEDLYHYLLQHRALSVVYECIMAIVRIPLVNLLPAALQAATSRFAQQASLRRHLLEILAPLDWHASIALEMSSNPVLIKN